MHPKVDNNYNDYDAFPRVIPTLPGFFGQLQDEALTNNREKRIIVANKLPLKAIPNRFPGFGWRFEWDKEALVLQLKDGFPLATEVVYVGTLPVEIELAHQDDVAEYLLDQFKCAPAFLSTELYNNYYHGFCKHYLWPFLHYVQPLTPNHGNMFDKDMWSDYVAANKIFADTVMQVVNPERDSVWVHDYHLMVLATFLRKRVKTIKLGFFLHSPFPAFEIYRTLPVREEILRAFLNCDLVGFHTHNYARYFMNCCSRILGLHSGRQSKRGYIGVEVYGRTVSVKTLPIGVHLGAIRVVMSLPDTANKIKELKRNYDGKFVLLGVNDMDMFKGIGMKFLAMGMLLDKYPCYRGNVVLIQIVNSPRSHGKDIQDVRDEITKTSNEVNGRYGDPASGYQPIVCVHGPVGFQDKVAYYSISECVVVNAFRDGMNLVPYKYTVVRQGCQELDNALEVKDKTPRKSVIIASEFIGCSGTLCGAIRINPWDVYGICEAMDFAIRMLDTEKEKRHKKHYKYIMSHDVSYWTRSLDEELSRACSENTGKIYWDLGFGLLSKFIALDQNFRKLPIGNIVAAYKNTKNRLILLDYDGTMLPQEMIEKSPSNEIISVLNNLCNDAKNTVFIVSGRGKESLTTWFSDCDKLGLSAEHGHFTRWSMNSEWISSRIPIHLDWKDIVFNIMNEVAKATDGSWIESKETAIVWHYQQESKPDGFAVRQAKDLCYHLQALLTSEPVVVHMGDQIVEVKAQGASKGWVLKYLAEAIKNRGQEVDFVLCIGSDISDEDMFEVISSANEEHSLPGTAELFSCTVGQKPSLAKFYLDDTIAVKRMLRTLSSSLAQQDARPASDLDGMTSQTLQTYWYPY